MTINARTNHKHLRPGGRLLTDAFRIRTLAELHRAQVDRSWWVTPPRLTSSRRAGTSAFSRAQVGFLNNIATSIWVDLAKWVASPPPRTGNPDRVLSTPRRTRSRRTATTACDCESADVACYTSSASQHD
jgi:hypothetical protein